MRKLRSENRVSIIMVSVVVLLMFSISILNENSFFISCLISLFVPIGFFLTGFAFTFFDKLDAKDKRNESEKINDFIGKSQENLDSKNNITVDHKQNR